MTTMETICTKCKHLKICKYSGEAMKLSSKISNDLKPDFDSPFTVSLKCDYRQETISSPRIRTDGI